jgi:predicted nucleic acid-binding protein
MYALVLYVDNNLLAEIEKNLLLILKAPEKVNRMMEEIKDITISFTTIPIFINSPDPKDNFLFDLAIQTNSEVIVTQEKVLLDFAESPVAIHNIKWFKETFPVPL